MASTNKTSNYELSQFLGTDKPAWLSDYNTDMSKIDTQMKANADAATAASGSATTANTAIGTLANLTTDDKTSVVAAINEVDSHADTAQNTANTASNTASGASTKADNALAGLAKFNLTNNSTLTPLTDKGSISGAYTAMYFATDSTSSIFKVYGRIRLDVGTATGTATITLGTTSLRPSSSYTINSAAIVSREYTDGSVEVVSTDITVATNGEITIAPLTLTYIQKFLITLPPCLYFNTDFGD